MAGKEHHQEGNTLQTMHPVFKELLSGGTAGAFAKSAVAPLERVKIIIQTSGALALQDSRRAAAATAVTTSTSTSGGLTTAVVRGGIPMVMRSIVTSEGVRGLWKGNGASVLRVVPYAALHFSAYERYRTWVLDIDSESLPRHVRSLGQTPAVDLVAGSMAGATAVSLTYPLDLLRTRMAWRSSGINAPRGPGAEAVGRAAGLQRSTILSMLGQIARKEGIAGFYKGVSPSLLGIFPYAGLKFFVYQYLKTLYVKGSPGSEGGSGDLAGVRVATSMKLVFGACAGLVAQTVTYPLDVVRRRMQVQDMVTAGDGAQGHHHRIRSSWHGLRLIYTTMGVRRGLYAGLSINYLKVVPSTAIGFAVYDCAKEYLHHRTHI
ncbi:mitochondrial carrier protein [Chloropicon primus]|uniref:Mitochondrial carrier protein n=1 Tax=Chloropicon primus TaxID=1764295 RepID=A0A5B8MR57_9CHLO|nr:mitochondrial carrier protein [Chloropicon primus]|eukprot:QDZ22817.1 mitochondrial carrier protein [Chloropicon primus]